MPQFQLLEALLTRSGQTGQTNQLGPIEGAVTYPEYLVLGYLHGDGTLSDTYDTGRTVERSVDEELDRLRFVYGARTIDKLFPGAKPTLPLAGPYNRRPILVPSQPATAHTPAAVDPAAAGTGQEVPPPAPVSGPVPAPAPVSGPVPAPAAGRRGRPRREAPASAPAMDTPANPGLDVALATAGL